jgi:hypothetical protein
MTSIDEDDAGFMTGTPMMIDGGMSVRSSQAAFKAFWSAESYGAHMGVYLGDGLLLHLSRQIDAPAIETLGEIQSREQYRHLVGFKTVRQVND